MSTEEKLATLMEQGRWISKELHEIKQDARDTKKDVKSLLAFKWKILGFASMSAFLATLAVEITKGALK